MNEDDRTPSDSSESIERKIFARKLIASILRRKQISRNNEALYQRLHLPFPQDFVDRTKLQKLCFYAARELESIRSVFPEVAVRQDLDRKHGPMYDPFNDEMNTMIWEGLIEEIPEPGSDRVLLRLSSSGEEWFSSNPPHQSVERELSNWGRMINISNVTVKAKIQYLKNIGSTGLRERPDAKAYNWEIVNLTMCAYVMASLEHPERNGHVTPYFVATTYGLPKSTVYKHTREMLRVGWLTKDQTAVIYGRLYVKPTSELIGMFQALRSRYERELLDRRNRIQKNKFEDPLCIL